MIFAKPWADALIVLLVVLLFFGPKRLPALGKSLGEGMREFKDSITGRSGSDSEDQPAGLAEGAPSPPTATSAPPAEPAAAPPTAPPPSSGPEPESAGVTSAEHRS